MLKSACPTDRFICPGLLDRGICRPLKTEYANPPLQEQPEPLIYFTCNISTVTPSTTEREQREILHTKKPETSQGVYQRMKSLRPQQNALHFAGAILNVFS